MLKPILIVIAIAAAWGWLVFFLVSRIRRPWLRKTLTRGSVPIVVVATGLYLLVEVASRRSPDDTIFRNRTTYAVEIFATPMDREPTTSIRLYFPHEVRWRDESAIDVSADASRVLAPCVAILRSSTSFEARTTQACQSSAPTSNAVAACGEVTRPNTLSFRWLLRGTNVGASYATIQLPRSLLQAVLPGSTWRGVITRDGQPITLGSPRSTTEWYSRRYDSDSRIRKPPPLSPIHRHLAIDGVEYNFASGEITLAIPVSQSLRDSDGWISIILTIIAGALGSGWAWQLLPKAKPARRSGIRSSKPA